MEPDGNGSLRFEKRSAGDVEGTFENAAVGIAHVALDGTWLRVNARAAEITGYSKAELLNTTFMQITHPEDLESDLSRAQALLAGEIDSYSMEKRYIRKDGSVVPVDLTVSLFRDAAGSPEYFISVIQDISERRRILEALSASETRLRLALEASHTGLWTWEPQSDVVTWSVEAYRIHGIPEGEFAGTGAAFFELVHPDDRARVETSVREAIEKGRTYESEFRIVRPDGSVAWVSNRGQASSPAAGRPVIVLGTITDITPRKREEEARAVSEERLRLALEASNAGVWDWNIETGRLYWSPESYRLHGVDRGAEVCAFEDWARYVDAADFPGFRQAIAETLEGQRSEFRETVRIVHPDHGLRWILSLGRVASTRQDRPLRISGLYLDITEHKRMEEALKEADAQKDRFLAMLSHELRSPLAPILSAALVLANQNAKADQVLAARRIVQRQVRQMSGLVDDLLDIARVKQGKLDLSPRRVSLAAIVETAMESARPLIDRKKHRLQVRLPPEDLLLEVDGGRLAQVLSNLLTNAAKYTDPEGAIELSGHEGHGHLELSVADNGVGLTEDGRKRLFTMFAQADDSHVRSEGGLGIGLALVKGIVERHGGVVEAQSDGPGRGSRFVVRLPSSIVVGRGRVAPTTVTHSQPRPHRVLVADDSADNADALVMLLQSYGQEVVVARGGEEAVRRAEDFRPDLAFVDLGMPDIDGYSVARTLRQRSWSVGMRLIALSGWGRDEDKRRSQGAGFDLHLTKPIDPDALIGILCAGPLPGRE